MFISSFPFNKQAAKKYITSADKFAQYESKELRNLITLKKICCQCLINSKRLEFWKTIEELNKLGCNEAIKGFLKVGRWT